MATVYLARISATTAPSPSKSSTLRLGLALGPERFLREIKLCARLQHPHIVAVLDSGDAGGHLWFTMPFVEGESLRDRLERKAVDLLQPLLDIPCYLSPGWLRVDPTFDPLRKLPRFQALVSGTP